MPRAKTPRTTTPSNKQVITMPEAVATTTIRKSSVSVPTPIDLQVLIQRRAYELYEQRGRMPGHEIEDWYQAEREVLASQTLQRTASA